MQWIIKDGVRFKLHRYRDEKELEDIVAGLHREIFGKDSVLFSKTHLRSVSGVGTIPDAFVISLSTMRWKMVEVELSSHSLHNHIVPQVSKFRSAWGNIGTQLSLSSEFYYQVKADPFKKALFDAHGIDDVHKFLTDVVRKPPEIVIVIDEVTEELKEVASVLPFPCEIIVLKTFVRDGCGLCAPIYVIETPRPGASLSRTAKTATSKNCNEENLMQKLIENCPECAPAIRRFHQFIKERADRIKWGKNCSMNVGFSALHPTYSLFTIKPDTRLYFHISWSDWSKSPLGRESQPIIHRKLLEIEALRGYIPEQIHDRWLEIPLKVWAQNVEGIIKAIEESIEEMERDIRSTSQKNQSE